MKLNRGRASKIGVWNELGALECGLQDRGAGGVVRPVDQCKVIAWEIQASVRYVDPKRGITAVVAE